MTAVLNGFIRERRQGTLRYAVIAQTWSDPELAVEIANMFNGVFTAKLGREVLKAAG
jgi:hypothetical protein